MKPLAELQKAIDKILESKWDRRDGQCVPDPEDLKHANDAVDLEATVLYADIADSTGLVQGYKDWFAAEIYKSYLLVASELIKNNGGTITAFDGDRVMGIFLGSQKNTAATKCALQINYMVSKEITPRVIAGYPDTSFRLNHAVGIDTSKIMATRTGVWGSNDVVWVGRAANYAAKLCTIREGNHKTFISSEVYSRLLDTSKYGGDPKANMWTKFTWEEFGTIAYKSSWRWKPS
jgi:class 3 adenylate cyclase